MDRTRSPPIATSNGIGQDFGNDVVELRIRDILEPARKGVEASAARMRQKSVPFYAAFDG